MRKYITMTIKDKFRQLEGYMIRIKDEIKTIIDDYSQARDISNDYNKYDGFFKGNRGTETPWNFVKHPFLLKVKGLLASLNVINRGK